MKFELVATVSVEVDDGFLQECWDLAGLTGDQAQRDDAILCGLETLKERLRDSNDAQVRFDIADALESVEGGSR